MRAQSVRLVAVEEVRNCGKIAYIKNIFENGRLELDAYPSSYLPPCHKLQKLSKESGMFQSLGTVNFVFFLLEGRIIREGAMAQRSPP